MNYSEILISSRMRFRLLFSSSCRRRRLDQNVQGRNIHWTFKKVQSTSRTMDKYSCKLKNIFCDLLTLKCSIFFEVVELIMF